MPGPGTACRAREAPSSIGLFSQEVGWGNILASNPIYSVFKREHALESPELRRGMLLNSGAVVSVNHRRYKY